MDKESLKLKQVLPYIDSGIDIRIYDQVSVNGDQWEIVFEGPAYNCLLYTSPSPRDS